MGVDPPPWRREVSGPDSGSVEMSSAGFPAEPIWKVVDFWGSYCVTVMEIVAKRCGFVCMQSAKR